MRIGYDGKRAVCNNTGLGNYSRATIDALAEYCPENEYLLYTPKMRHNENLQVLLNERANVKVQLPAEGHHWGSALWRVGNGIVRDAQADGVQLFHGLSGELPLTIAQSGIPSVVTMHDVIFRRYPEYYKWIDRKIYDYKFARACENATRIIAITECTKRDIMQFYGADENKIDVVYQGCDARFAEPIAEATLASVRAQYHLPEQFLLYVGTVETRKNVLLAVRALEQMREEALPLVIVGRETPYAAEVRNFVAKAGMSDRVLFVGHVSLEHLPALYRMARVFVYPSRFEGFGIPILEAITCGTPVVAATGSCLEEAGGDCALYVDPDDVSAMMQALGEAMTEGDLRRSMLSARDAHLRKFTRESIARNISAVYQKALNVK